MSFYRYFIAASLIDTCRHGGSTCRGVLAKCHHIYIYIPILKQHGVSAPCYHGAETVRRAGTVPLSCRQIIILSQHGVPASCHRAWCRYVLIFKYHGVPASCQHDAATVRRVGIVPPSCRYNLILRQHGVPASRHRGAGTARRAGIVPSWCR